MDEKRSDVIELLIGYQRICSEHGIAPSSADILAAIKRHDSGVPIVRASDVPYDPQGPEVRTLHHWFAENYSAANWMDDGCRSENARGLLNTLSKAGFIVVPTPTQDPNNE